MLGAWWYARSVYGIVTKGADVTKGAGVTKGADVTKRADVTKGADVLLGHWCAATCCCCCVVPERVAMLLGCWYVTRLVTKGAGVLLGW